MTIVRLKKEGVLGTRTSGIDSGPYVNVLNDTGSCLVNLILQTNHTRPDPIAVQNFLKSMDSMNKHTYGKQQIFKGNHSDNTETYIVWSHLNESLLSTNPLMAELYQMALNHPQNENGEQPTPSLMPWESANLPLFSETRRALLQIPHWPRRVWVEQKLNQGNQSTPLPLRELLLPSPLRQRLALPIRSSSTNWKLTQVRWQLVEFCLKLTRLRARSQWWSTIQEG